MSKIDPVHDLVLLVRSGHQFLHIDTEEEERVSAQPKPSMSASYARGPGSEPGRPTERPFEEVEPADGPKPRKPARCNPARRLPES